MPFDDGLAHRLEEVIMTEFKHIEGLSETRMFGGFGYLLNGNMCIGIYKDSLIIRVGKDKAADLITKYTDVREMDLTGRVMGAWAIIDPGAMGSDDELEYFCKLAIDFVSELPAKTI